MDSCRSAFKRKYLTSDQIQQVKQDRALQILLAPPSTHAPWDFSYRACTWRTRQGGGSGDQTSWTLQVNGLPR